nr:RNA-directed DNA polymerase, eukaryota, reverse transcriptase zinc-binding domain protein [Tanacetum cinerariifolium]
LSSDLKVSDIVCNGQWRWPTEWHESSPMITILDVPAIKTDNDDKLFGELEREEIWTSLIYNIWQERNVRSFKELKRSSDEVFKNIVEMIKNKLIGITVKDSLAVRDIERSLVLIQGCLDLGYLSFLSISET